MGFSDFFARPDINQYVQTFQNTPQGILLDVRTPEEYAAGHIPQSCNHPLQEIHTVETRIPDKTTPVFVYCRSGRRSGEAVKQMQQMGYTKAVNIGGILSYTGNIEK